LVIIYFIIGYFTGSIPFGYIFVKNIKNIDIRDYGSGNIGATNVKRILGLKWAIVTFIFDALKGFIPAFLAYKYLQSPWSFTVMLSPFIGHCYTIWLKGNGGKGVATSAGILFATVPLIFSVLFILWILIVILTKKSSLGAVVIAILLPFTVYFFNKKIDLTFFTIILSIWVIIRHKENIIRILNRKENNV